MTPILAQRQRPDRGFERLYRRHVGDVYRYALAVMRNQPDAEDVTQTTFLNAYRAYERGERPEKPQNWLIAIAHNVCRQRFRQSARRPTEIGFDDDIGNRLVEPDDETPTGEDIRRALGHLAFNQRAALVMRELEGRSYAEIADILDLSSSAVETLIFRARRALREQLETSLTCGEAELAISRQLDGRLPRKDKGALRAHLRQCPDCATFARRQRAQRTALKSLAAVPVPGSLLSLFGGGGATVGTGLALKAAAALTAGALIGGAGYEGVREVTHQHKQQPAAREHQAGSHATPKAPAPTPAAATVQTSRQGSAASAKKAKHRVGTAAASAVAYGRAARAHERRVAAGDASVASRHVHVRLAHTARSHPMRRAPTPKRTHVARGKKPLPGPYDAGPPPGNGGGGHGHGP